MKNQTGNNRYMTFVACCHLKTKDCDQNPSKYDMDLNKYLIGVFNEVYHYSTPTQSINNKHINILINKLCLYNL